MQRIANYIYGEILEPQSGAYLDNLDPATGRIYSQTPDSDAQDVELAVAAAEQAFPRWSRMSPEERSRILMRIADLIESHLDQLALAECVDTGKPLARCRNLEIPRAARNFRFFAAAILNERSELHAGDNAALNYTLRRPRGVVGLISPWNLPLLLFTWKVAPALAAGNTAVAKPSEVTPMTAYLLGLICREAGLPPGVLNIVHGRGASAGAALVGHPRVQTISFTGGTKTGAEIARVAGPRFKKLSLELGGKNPNIVFADAPLEEALNVSVQAAFANQGQICLCGSRLLVQKSIYVDFVSDFVEQTRALRIGDPLQEGVDQGALVSREQLEKTAHYAQLAREEGGEILIGGKRPAPVSERCQEGYFFEPTVIVGLGAECRTNQEEIFGPVVTVLPFEDEAEALAIANSTAYGLSASLWTSDLARAHRMAEQIESGTVWVNCWMLRDLRVPFGGMKQSGVGREGGDEAMRFFTEPKNICVRIPPADG